MGRSSWIVVTKSFRREKFRDFACVRCERAPEKNVRWNFWFTSASLYANFARGRAGEKGLAKMPRYSRAGVLLVLIAGFGLAACTTERSSVPQRTATEQLLISTAADRAAREMSLAIPRNTKVYIDHQYFQGYDEGYALNAIRTQFLRQGLAIVDDRKDAEAVVTLASGALSTDEKALLIGIPALQVPFFPIGTSVSVPEIALFKSAQDKGVAKFVATGYDAKSGKLIATTDPQYGISHQTNHTVLLFFSWQTGDLEPPGVDKNSLSVGNIAAGIPNALGIMGSTDRSKSQ